MAKPKTDDGGGKSGRKAEKEGKPKLLTPSNLTKLRGELSDYLDEMDQKKDDQEKMNGEFAVDIGNIKESFANKTGHSKRTLTKLHTTHRRLLKEEKWRKEAEAADVDAFDEVMAASEGIKDSPLWRVAREKMVEASDGKVRADQEGQRLMGAP